MSSADDRAEAVIGLGAAVLLAGSPWLVDTSGPYPFYEGPLIFPVIALAIMTLAAFPAVVRLVRERSARVRGHGGIRGVSPSLRLFAVMCLFPAAVLVVGLEASTWLFMAVGLRLAGYRNSAVTLATATAVTVVVYIAFRLVLDVWFPTPVLLTWLNMA